MWDRVEVISNIHVHKPFDRLPLSIYLLQCGVGGSSCSKTMRMVIKDGFVDPFQDASHHLLNQFVIPRRDAEWAFLAIFLRDMGPANWLKSIGSAFESRDNGRDPFFGEPIEGNFIYAWRRCPCVGIDVGVGFMPQDRVFQQSEYPIDRFPLF